MKSFNGHIFNFITKNKFILIIIFLAAILRLPAIFWGIGFFNEFEFIYHPDEPKIITAAFYFPQKLLMLPHPTLFHYFIGTVTLPVKIMPFYSKLPMIKAYFLIYLFARIITFCFAIGSIILTYILGNKIYSRKHGLMASLLVTISMIHAITSTVAICYIPLGFFVLLGFYMLYDLRDIEDMQKYRKLGIVTGFIISTKFFGLLFLVPLTADYICTYKKHFIKLKHLKKILLCLLISLIILFATTPTLLSKNIWESFPLELRELDRYRHSLYDISLWAANFKYFFNAFGIPLALLYLISLFFPMKKKFIEILFIIFIFSLYLYVRTEVKMRYIIPLIPLFALLSSQAIMHLGNSNKLKKVMTFLFSFVVIYSTFYSISAVYLRINDTRTQSAHFIAENISEGTGIGIGAISEKIPWRRQLWRYPAIDFSKYREINFLDKPDFLILSSYDFQKIENALKSPHLSSDYKWDEKYNTHWYRYAPPSPEIFKLYDELLIRKSSEYELIKSFKKWNIVSIEFPPPEIRIYQKIKGLEKE